MQKITPISFLDFCKSLAGNAPVKYAIEAYDEYTDAISSKHFADIIENRETLQRELDFCRRMNFIGTTLNISRVIYKNHVNK